MEQTFSQGDFRSYGRRSIIKTLTFSTWGRAGHRFEPRLYWPGLSSVALHRVDLVSLDSFSLPSLEQKALHFEELMETSFLDRGFVVARGPGQQIEDIGDAAIWTGLYAAAEGWRYRATRSSDARRRMERSLWALHRLHQRSPIPGTLVRYVFPNGDPYLQVLSRDVFVGFFFAMEMLAAGAGSTLTPSADQRYRGLGATSPGPSTDVFVSRRPSVTSPTLFVYSPAKRGVACG